VEARNYSKWLGNGIKFFKSTSFDTNKTHAQVPTSLQTAVIMRNRSQCIDSFDVDEIES